MNVCSENGLIHPLRAYKVQTRDHDKSRRYIDLLDSARCNDAWQEVPELIRKVKKHAPERNCTISSTRQCHAGTNFAFFQAS